MARAIKIASLIVCSITLSIFCSGSKMIVNDSQKSCSNKPYGILITPDMSPTTRYKISNGKIEKVSSLGMVSLCSMFQYNAPPSNTAGGIDTDLEERIGRLEELVAHAAFLREQNELSPSN